MQLLLLQEQVKRQFVLFDKRIRQSRYSERITSWSEIRGCKIKGKCSMKFRQELAEAVYCKSTGNGFGRKLQSTE